MKARGYISLFEILLSQLCGGLTSVSSARRTRVITAAFILLCPAYIIAEDWKGIRPLISTEKDVVKLLGECEKRGGEVSCEYGRVKIDYVTRTCDEGGEFNVPKGTVVAIGIAFDIKRNADGTSIRPKGTFDDIDFREKLGLPDLKSNDFELKEDDYYKFRYFSSVKRGIEFATLGSTILQAIFSAPKELKEKMSCLGKTKLIPVSATPSGA